MYSDVVKILESNDEEQFLKMREAALYFLCNTAQEVINNWCKEAGVTSPVGYYNNLSKKEFMIYTDRPGYMIGRAGILVSSICENVLKKSIY